MAVYEIKIQELLARVVKINAKSSERAISKVSDL